MTQDEGEGGARLLGRAGHLGAGPHPRASTTATTSSPSTSTWARRGMPGSRWPGPGGGRRRRGDGGGARRSSPATSAFRRYRPTHSTRACIRSTPPSAGRSSPSTWSLPRESTVRAAVAHGSTGKGNDQVRFDLGTKGLAPDLEIVAPQRERNISRDAAMEYAAQHGIPVPASKKSPFSIDENLWGRSIEGGVLEDPARSRPRRPSPGRADQPPPPPSPGSCASASRPGCPVSVDGKPLGPAALIRRVGEVAGLHGVGRIDLMENRMVGIKSREVYEAPAAVALIAAHQDLERFTTIALSHRVKRELDERFANMVYEGFWFSPAARGDPGLQRRPQPHRHRRGDAAGSTRGRCGWWVGPRPSASTTRRSPPTAGGPLRPPRRGGLHPARSACSCKNTRACTARTQQR